MVDQASKPFLIIYVIVFSVISIITAIQLGRSFKVTQQNKYKIRTHICISIICILSILENSCMIAHNDDRDSDLFDLGDIPQRLVWIFLITAYLDVVYIWICAYESVGEMAEHVRKRARVLFVITDAVMGVVLLISAVVNFAEGDKTAGKVARTVYAASLSAVNISFSALFLVYGIRIARRLKDGMKRSSGNANIESSGELKYDKAQIRVHKFIYRMTIRTIVVSIIWIIGAILFLVFGFVGNQSTGKVQLIRTVHWSVLMGQMLYLAKPKRKVSERGVVSYT